MLGHSVVNTQLNCPNTHLRLCKNSVMTMGPKQAAERCGRLLKPVDYAANSACTGTSCHVLLYINTIAHHGSCMPWPRPRDNHTFSLHVACQGQRPCNCKQAAGGRRIQQHLLLDATRLYSCRVLLHRLGISLRAFGFSADLASFKPCSASY
jgi:hypothetical protein